MDNGKVKIYLRDSIPVIEICHDGEIDLVDVIWIHHNIYNGLEPSVQRPSDIIIDRVGSYSLSEDAYMSVTKLMQESNRVAYVIHHPLQEIVVDLAINTYLSQHEVEKFYTLDEAIEWLL